MHCKLGERARQFISRKIPINFLPISHKSSDPLTHVFRTQDKQAKKSSPDAHVSYLELDGKFLRDPLILPAQLLVLVEQGLAQLSGEEQVPLLLLQLRVDVRGGVLLGLEHAGFGAAAAAHAHAGRVSVGRRPGLHLVDDVLETGRLEAFVVIVVFCFFRRPE